MYLCISMCMCFWCCCFNNNRKQTINNLMLFKQIMKERKKEKKKLKLFSSFCDFNFCKNLIICTRLLKMAVRQAFIYPIYLMALWLLWLYPRKGKSGKYFRECACTYSYLAYPLRIWNCADDAFCFCVTLRYVRFVLFVVVPFVWN